MSAALKFGRGARFQLPKALSALGCQKPLVITDKNLLALPLVRELLDSIPNVSIFSDCEAEPAIEVAESAVGAARSCFADGVIGLGGGSNMDVAKMVAAVVRHGGQPGDYFGFDNVPGPCLPVFALPTTAGTGSEVSHSAVLTDNSKCVKVSTLSPWLRPAMAIVDPALTDSCPRRVTAESGIDALVHAIEAYTNKDFTEMVNVDPQARAYEGSFDLTRQLAGEAIRRVSRSLVLACEEPTATEARDDLALAATYAGMAFSNSGVGIVHALEYPIGALTHCGHGEGNGLLLPHVMRYNLTKCQHRFAEIAQFMRPLSPADTHSSHIEFSSDAVPDLAGEAIERVIQLQDAIGIRKRLRDLGLVESDIPGAAAKAFEIKRLMDLNRRVPSEADLESILRAAH
ncbi:MAG: iron-containing alcohol dehydrogenase [Pirellulaceae bacterium]